MTTPLLSMRLLDTGYCTVSESAMLRGGERRAAQCHALVALLRHPQHGWLLWDTGYAPRMLGATMAWPYWIYRITTPLSIERSRSVASQLLAMGVGPEEVRHVLISHFHGDHVAGLRDFPDATVVATRAAYEDVAGRTGLAAIRRGYLPDLLPEGFERQSRLLLPFSGPPLPGLGPTFDLFDDGSVVLVGLPGHARGQIGALVQTERGPVLLAADGCWLSRAYRERRPPPWYTAVMTDDFRAVCATIDGLHAFAQARPDVLIVPTHCPAIYEAYVAE
ncbi:MBL fold metallo-hydrolase [Chloroflexia bacterium SDU3-3]|nr:MBL fold metallo-hydrolase [Chloroflexia bacterium SDU3-3]